MSGQTLKVMLVDDEAIVREDMRALFDWEANGYEIVAEADNGLAALESFERQKVDIMIVDIQMPVMNGLELASRILSEHRQVKFIFLTAYSDFEFARTSMRLGVDSYILKHEMDSCLLLKELERLRGELQKTGRQSLFDQNQAMHLLLCTQQSRADYRRIIRENGIAFREGYSYLITVEIDGEEKNRDRKVQIAAAVSHAANDSRITGCTVFSLEVERVGALLVLKPDKAGDQRLSVTNHLNHIKEQIRLSAGRDFFILVSEKITRAEEFPSIYARLKRHSARCWFYRTPCILSCGCETEENTSCDGEVKELCGLLKEHKYVKADESLTLLFDHMFPAKGDKAYCEKCLIRITDCLAAAWNYENNGSPELSAVELYREAAGCRNVFEAGQRLKCLLAQIRQAEEGKYRERIDRVKAYVEEHYTEDLSLESLGRLIGVSESYMSQLFKQQTGVTFKTYLRDFRMKKAKEMLLSGREKVHDVGAKIGYRTTPYFCLVFKQYFGVTPTEFIRRYSGKNEEKS